MNRRSGDECSRRSCASYCNGAAEGIDIGIDGRVKGQTSIKILKKFRYLRKKPYWGNHFWSKGYCVDTVGLDAEMIRRYVKYQEKKDRYEEQLTFAAYR